MTEPSKEAVELLAETAWEHSRKTDIELGERPAGEYAKAWDQAAEHLKDEWRAEAARTIAIALPIERERWEKETRRRVSFGSVQIGGQPVTHLEHWPGGVTLCGIDMFPDVPPSQRPGFSRGGGDSSREAPCPECVRRAKRYLYSCEVHIGGSMSGPIRAAIFDKGEGDG